MKTNRVFYIALVFALESCESHEFLDVKTEQIVGSWSSEEILFNGKPGSEFLPGIDMGFHLAIHKDKSFYRNYVWGSWEVNNNVLRLIDKFTATSVKEFEIIEISEKTLTIRTLLTEGEYCCDFDAFGENEKISITERYIRNQ
jgi:hypothetical protein